jgi:hypothetical protein
MPCASFSMLDQALKMMHMASKASAKNSSKLNKFLYSEVNLLIQHHIVQDQDGQNNNMKTKFQNDPEKPHKVLNKAVHCSIYTRSMSTK